MLWLWLSIESRSRTADPDWVRWAVADGAKGDIENVEGGPHRNKTGLRGQAFYGFGWHNCRLAIRSTASELRRGSHGLSVQEDSLPHRFRRELARCVGCRSTACPAN